MAKVRTIRCVVKISGPGSGNHILVQTVHVTFLLVTDHGQSSISIDRGTIKIEVSTITLANTLKDMPSIHLIKMDLEGAELGALKGMGSDLEKVHAIIFENRGAKDVVEYLQAHCFNITRLDGNNALALKAT